LEGESASIPLAEVLVWVGRFGSRSRNLQIPRFLKEIFNPRGGDQP
jgi:hypothetical protein